MPGEFGRGRVRFAPCAKVPYPISISIVPRSLRAKLALVHTAAPSPAPTRSIDFRRLAVGCKLRGASSKNAAAQGHPPGGSMLPPAPDAKTHKKHETLHHNSGRNTCTTSRGTQNLAKAQAERGPRLRGARTLHSPRGPADEHVRRARLRPVLLDLRIRVARAGFSCVQFCQLRFFLPQRRHDGERRRRISQRQQEGRHRNIVRRRERRGALRPRRRRVDGCVETNQCVGCTRQFFTMSFLGDDAAVLAPSSGEEPASPRYRAGVASMAWRTTRRCTNAP